MTQDSTHNFSKASSTMQKAINVIRKKWNRDMNKNKVLKYENNQLHRLVDDMLADGRLTKDELRKKVNNRQEIRQLLNVD